MNLGIDGRGAIWYRGTGIGTYTWRLLSALEKEKNCKIFLPGMELAHLHFSDNTVLEIDDSEKYWKENFLPKAITEEDIGLYHVLQNGLGLPAKKQCKETVTIHDMIPYMFPETVGRGYLKAFLKEMPKVMMESDGIIAVSESSKKDILSIFDYPADNIHVIGEAPEPIYRPMDKQKTAEILKEKYGIVNDYILYVGGFGLRKNVKSLLLGYYLLKKEENISWHLVLPGKRSGEFERLDAMVEALELKDFVHFCGYVPVTDLPWFYNGASVMVYPSLYEGFGLPPLEAMATGCPVVAAKASSLPEVLGDAPIYFDPLNSVALAEALWSIYSNPENRKNYSEHSLAQAKKFSWEKTVEETKNFFQTIYEK